MSETISFFSKKTHFFRFFGLFFENPKNFSGSFCPQKNEHHNFFRCFLKSQCIFSNILFFSKKKVIFFHEKSSALDRTINSPYALNHSFFLNRLTDLRVKCSFFLNSSLMLTTLVFFKPPHHACSENTRFFWKNNQKKLQNDPPKSEIWR